MSASGPAKRLAVASDLIALGDDPACEIIGGDIVQKAAPGPDHGTAQFSLAGLLFGSRGGGPGNAGGWWLMTEVEVEYEPHEVYRHDLVGWRRENAIERPRARPVRTRPDWVCEVLSSSNASNDTVRKLRGLQRAALPHYWILDPERRTLLVLRWTPQGWLEALSAAGDEVVQAEPFEDIEIRLAELFDGG